jgi:hypothetical protein
MTHVCPDTAYPAAAMPEECTCGGTPMTALTVNTRKLAELRESMPDGTLPAYAWPGGYPIVYYTEEGLTVCPVCANDPDTSDPVADADIYYEGPPIVCDDKGEMIESAYGDPEAPE